MAVKGGRRPRSLSRLTAINQGEERPPMSRMGRARSGPETRAGGEGKSRRLRDLSERERIELRRDLAQEPGPIARFGVFLRPLTVASMVRGIRFASLRVRLSAGARVRALAGLCRERLSCRCDRAFGPRSPSARQTRLAVTAPTLLNGLSA